jgi:hypothetical protein
MLGVTPIAKLGPIEPSSILCSFRSVQILTSVAVYEAKNKGRLLNFTQQQ